MVTKQEHIQGHRSDVRFSDLQNPYQDDQFPKVTIIVPTFNCVHIVSLTLDHILNQQYPHFEIVVVDAGSQDGTLGVIKNYRDERIRLCTVSSYQRYEMLNKGIAYADGEYVNCLFPGDFYLGKEVLKHMMTIALNEQFPGLIFCGTFLRDGRRPPKTLFRHLSLQLLKMGQQPTSLQSCWFKTDALKALGKFNTSYTLRGGYELMCRFALNRHLKSASTNRVFIDYDLRLVTRRMVMTHFYETAKTVFHYFGLYATVRWGLRQRDILRFLKLWLRNVRGAFMGN